MTEDEVRGALGAPDGFVREGEYSALQYKSRLLSGFSWDRMDYGLIFRSGRLRQWAAGTVRQDPTRRAVFVVIR
jgi:hypothetical protein